MSVAAERRRAASLWRYCVAIYRRPGVRRECLALQRRLGVNVNLLLLGAYVGSELGAELAARDVAAAARLVGSWHSGIVAPLRALRQRARRAAISVSTNQALPDALHARLLAAELAAERVEVANLAAWCERHRASWRRGERGAAAARNLQRVLGLVGGSAASVPRRLLAAAGAPRRVRTAA